MGIRSLCKSLRKSLKDTLKQRKRPPLPKFDQTQSGEQGPPALQAYEDELSGSHHGHGVDVDRRIPSITIRGRHPSRGINGSTLAHGRIDGDCANDAPRFCEHLFQHDRDDRRLSQAATLHEQTGFRDVSPHDRTPLNGEASSCEPNQLDELDEPHWSGESVNGSAICSSREPNYSSAVVHIGQTIITPGEPVNKEGEWLQAEDYWSHRRSVTGALNGPQPPPTDPSPDVSPVRVGPDGGSGSDRSDAVKDSEVEFDGPQDVSEILPATHKNSAGGRSIHSDFLRLEERSGSTLNGEADTSIEQSPSQTDSLGRSRRKKKRTKGSGQCSDSRRDPIGCPTKPRAPASDKGVSGIESTPCLKNAEVFSPAAIHKDKEFVTKALPLLATPGLPPVPVQLSRVSGIIDSGVLLEVSNKVDLAKNESPQVAQQPQQLHDNQSTVNPCMVTAQGPSDAELRYNYGATDMGLLDWIDLHHTPTDDAYRTALFKGDLVDLEADSRIHTQRTNEETDSREDLDTMIGMNLCLTKFQRPNDHYHAHLWQFAGECEHFSALPWTRASRITVKENDPNDRDAEDLYDDQLAMNRNSMTSVSIVSESEISSDAHD